MILSQYSHATEILAGLYILMGEPQEGHVNDIDELSDLDDMIFYLLEYIL